MAASFARSATAASGPVCDRALRATERAALSSRPVTALASIAILQYRTDMRWTVELLSATVRAELEAQPRDIRARYLRIVELIESHGLERIREPYVKHLEGPLWEMRLKGHDRIARAVYVTARGRRVVVVRVFAKKTQKTPRREIELALRRAKEVT
jgi:phage-related protein